MLALIGVLGIGLFIYLLARGRHSMIVAFVVPILLIPIACCHMCCWQRSDANLRSSRNLTAIACHSWEFL